MGITFDESQRMEGEDELRERENIKNKNTSSDKFEIRRETRQQRKGQEKSQHR